MSSEFTGPHKLMMAGTVWDMFTKLMEHEKGGAEIIAGAYSRPLMMRNGSFFVETEAQVNVIDIQTHTVFVDLRVPVGRFNTSARSLQELSMGELCALAKQQCFAGYSVVEHDIEGYEGLPVCNRLHSIDWTPAVARRPNNQWRIQTAFDKGAYGTRTRARS